MNYIREINAFYDWLETNSISDSAIVLWHALMHINNKAGWITEFAVAISTLETKTGLKKDAIIRARHRLQQVCRITFRSRTGQQSAIYTIIPFDCDCAVLNDTNCDTNHNTNRALTATQTTTQTASINKLNIKETKQDNIPSPSISDDGFFEKSWKSYPHKKGKGKIKKTQIARLNKTLGLDHFLRCITRYKESKPDWQEYMHGSTFYNSGYVDYTDQNYQEQPTRASPVKGETKTEVIERIFSEMEALENGYQTGKRIYDADG